MKVGTKSLLFGVHQFALHPLFVLVAWCKLYGRPSWREFVCIVIHDWGYWGKPNMDGEEGGEHPEWAAIFAHRFLDRKKHWSVLPQQPLVVGYSLKNTYRDLCLYHSRHYARRFYADPSRLCWADKLSITLEPWWLYLPRALASGELAEYRQQSADYFPLSSSHRRWFVWLQSLAVTMAEQQRGDAAPYMNQGRDKVEQGRMLSNEDSEGLTKMVTTARLCQECFCFYVSADVCPFCGSPDYEEVQNDV